MAGYADVEDPVALLNRTPEGNTGPQVADAIRNAGFEVQAVNWVWERIVGESLVDSIIKPITGDFDKIAEQAGQWKNVAAALQAVRNNLNAGLGELQPAWQGEAADRFRNLIGTTWTLGIEADAQAANLIGFALTKVAQGSRMACDQILHLIKVLVDKLIEAAAMLPIPVVGWGRAVKLVYDGMQIYNAIMQLIEGIRAIIAGAQQVIDGIQQVGTALSKIDDIRNLNDALNVANEAGQGIATTASGARQVQYGATQAAGAAGDLAQSASSARDNATALRDERAAAHDQSLPGGTTSSSAGGRGRSPGGTEGSSMRENAGNTHADSRERVCAPGSGDPVDLTSGQMFMGQVDVELPSILPLEIERTHFSSYRVGRFFGRSWASTLDQRLEVEGDAIYFAGSDGARLRYPVPMAHTDEVLSDSGPRWPLARSTTGDYTVTQPELGRVLHFSAGMGPRSITAITDRNGNRIEFHYDATGAPAEIRHFGGYQIGIRTANGLVTALLLNQPGGAPITLVRYGYNDLRQLTEVINSSGRALRFEYDPAGRVTSWIDRNGEWYRYHYDAAGRVTHTEGSGGALTGSWKYDEKNRVTRYTNSLGHTASYHYNEKFQITREIDPLGNETRQEWDGYNRLAARTDPLGRTTRYDYDEAGNLVGITRPDGARALADYNDLGLPVQVVDPDGTTWRQEYDERGNRVAVIDAAGAVTRHRFDEHGRLTEIIDALGQVRRIRTNAAGLPIAVTDSLGRVTRYERDELGRVVAVTDPLGGTVRYGWTVEGKPLWRTLPDGATERWRYDGEGAEIEYRDALGQSRRTETTHFELPAVRHAPDGSRLHYEYDADLKLISITNQLGLVWRYEYDVAGNLIGETDFDGRQVRYERDAAGQLISKVNGAGQEIRFTRNLMGELIERRTTDGVATFEYDRAGRLVRATNADTELILERDPVGRVLSETVNGRTLRSTFDRLGRRTRRVTPGGVVSEAEFDGSNQRTMLRAGGHTLTFGYDPAGREIERLLDAGTIIAQSWDRNNRLSSQTVSVGAPAPDGGGRARILRQRSYRYRADGYVAAIEDSGSGPLSYDLDPVGRVASVHGQGWNERYSYDGLGNVAAAEWPATDRTGQGTREYGGTRLIRAGNIRYQYDDHGRVVLKQKKRISAGPDTWRYAWDADDRLTTLITPDGTSWRYVYDPLGRRVAKNRMAQDGVTVVETVHFTWDGSLLAEQVAGDGMATSWEFDADGFRPIAQIEGPVADATQASVDRRFFSIITDLVGTPVELVDTAGAVAWFARVNLWGADPVAMGGYASTPLRFPGQYHDAESGLNYNYHRHYDPETARYVSEDPLGLAPAPNPYAYVHNPTTWCDLIGLAGSSGCPSANYTSQSAHHVYTHGHAANSPHIPGKSRFRVGEGGQKFTDEVMGHPNVQVTHQTNGRTRYDVTDLGRGPVGWDQQGNPTNGGQVLVEGPNPHPNSQFSPDEVVTQYPL